MSDPLRGLAGSSAPCSDEGHCITCSDEGVAMRVLAVTGDGLALCAVPGGAVGDVMEVMTDLVAPVLQGDELLVHAGVALLRLPGVGTEAVS